MTGRMSRIRLFVEDPLATGRVITLPREAAHYLVTVMRCSTGDGIRLFNGRDGEWRGQLVDARRGHARIEIGAQCRPQIEEKGPSLLFAPVKRARTDLIIEKATELGAARILPVETARGIAERVRLPRLEKIAREAAEQCGRLTLPVIDAPAALARVLADWPGDRPFLFCDTGGTAPPLAAACRDLPAAWPPAVLVGPEGGFTEAERRL
ncbi:MAG: 16S rRNA (uracil(1498)-N(3))-methyltransferase, partial [Alphaproteobacteria bacterium]